jgi:hypothetical protein
MEDLMFIPKNIDKRAKDLEIIKAKELKDYEAFIKEFQHNLKLMKGKTSNDLDLINPQEQLFIDLIKDCQIKLDQTEYPFCIFLMKNESLFKDDKWMFKYKWKNDEFWCHYDLVWLVFESKFDMRYYIWKDFISNTLEKHFKFRPSTTFAVTRCF